MMVIRARMLVMVTVTTIHIGILKGGGRVVVFTVVVCTGSTVDVSEVVEI